MTTSRGHDDLQRLLDLDDDLLLVQLADDVAAGVGPLDPDRKRRIAKAWLDAQEDRLRDAVCSDPRVSAARADGEALLIAAAIADLVAPLFGGPPAATVAVLLVRRGLDRLCG
ncbi:hypothetical protein GKE82_24330 [Conexibacter sp. W3-3-2]|uniref:hypothetical protein n=1 Tax=Conexibacter sp. W3-3-2 TaxID=2675227 RepID=UPI0012B83D35|nr:hypothetical protein [Conexibacter sp. W3-3-2]MTD47337.1 hypothetical protein [Conexibacter sp. W3-3-2]